MKTLKSIKSSHETSSKAPVEEDTEETFEDEAQQNKEQVDSLRSQIADMQLKQEHFFKQTCDWRDEFAQNVNQQIAQLSAKMDNYHSEIMRHFYQPPPPPPE